MIKCDYKNCENEATTKGFVFGRPEVPGGSYTQIDLVACDKHKNHKGFLQTERLK